MENNRIYGDKTNIDKNKVNQFFEKRFNKENPLASVMVRGNSEDDIAEKRNINEQNVFRKLINYESLKSIKTFDIGCGLGRWAKNLENIIEVYDGIDFTKNYIVCANEEFSDKQNVNFFQMSATEIDEAQLNDPYDIIIINGLCVYLNDDDVIVLLQKLSSLTKPNGKVYLRESVSTIDKRLTLKDFPSEELGVDYNAVYRTRTEYEKFITEHLKSFNIITTDLLLNKELGAREETNQRYWLLQKV